MVKNGRQQKQQGKQQKQQVVINASKGKQGRSKDTAAPSLDVVFDEAEQNAIASVADSDAKCMVVVGAEMRGGCCGC